MQVYKEIKGNHGVLRGYIHLASSSKIKGSCVIIHGYFSSQKLGPARLYLKIAKLFSSIGYHTLRFDSFGTGESDGELENCTIDTRLDDLHKITEEAYKLSDKVIFIAHSLGTLIATEYIFKYGKINYAILISPTFGKIDRIHNMFSARDLALIKRYELITRKSLKIRWSVINYSENYTFCDFPKIMKTKFIFAYGNEDDFYELSSIRERISMFNRVIEILELAGADHNFIKHNSQAQLLSFLRYCGDNYLD